jgi:hypothetical protein
MPPSTNNTPQTQIKTVRNTNFGGKLMRNLMYSIGAVAALAVIMFSSAGTRPALAASRTEDRAAWGETAVLISDSPDVLGGSSDNVLVDAAAEAEAAAEVDAAADAEAEAAADAEANVEADAAAQKIDKTMKLRLFPQGGKHGVYAL